MSIVSVKDKGSCRFDQISLGEIMLRLDPGDMRIRTARSFRAWEGGGEYNVARGAVGVSDRGHTAASQLGRGDVDWEEIFGKQGVRWFHTGGIYAGLSET